MTGFGIKMSQPQAGQAGELDRPQAGQLKNNDWRMSFLCLYCLPSRALPLLGNAWVKLESSDLYI